MPFLAFRSLGFLVRHCHWLNLCIDAPASHQKTLDRIADPRTFYKGLWTTNVVDSDLVMRQFFKDCHKAGPSRCSFYLKNGPASKEGKLVATPQLLNTTLLPVASSDSHDPDVITYSDIMKMIKLADLLSSVSNGGTGADFAIYKMKAKNLVYPDEPSEDLHHIRECPPYSETALDTVTSIGCTDAEDLSAVSMDERNPKSITISFVNRASG
ncbi:hypothetical protein NA56DRAFT_666609 [Hyaloscypha hepaticicola]|uniref:Uncharacterized protein n=1 Tax=Hyaloscypha hepaticicola TaxID=2082293 RepID=A0A2J6PDL3_9HELO|nr:hypothetical protein NA56DRAFT_666609 [Hyaloscypha hepaticicola]